MFRAHTFNPSGAPARLTAESPPIVGFLIAVKQISKPNLGRQTFVFENSPFLLWVGTIYLLMEFNKAFSLPAVLVAEASAAEDADSCVRARRAQPNEGTGPVVNGIAQSEITTVAHQHG